MRLWGKPFKGITVRTNWEKMKKKKKTGNKNERKNKGQKGIVIEECIEGRKRRDIREHGRRKEEGGNVKESH